MSREQAPPFEGQKRTNGLPQVTDQHTDAKKQSTWPSMHFLSSAQILFAWHQYSFNVCTGIGSHISTVLIRQGYCVNVAIFAVCDSTICKALANPAYLIFCQMKSSQLAANQQKMQSLTPRKLKLVGLFVHWSIVCWQIKSEGTKSLIK